MPTMLSPQQVLHGYTMGIFPMADSDGSIYWYSPDPRAIIPFETYKPSKSLKPIINQNIFEIRINHDFLAVIKACSMPRIGDSETWISEEIIEAYHKLHLMGYAFSFEAYQQNKLVGGLYGVSITRRSVL